MQARASNVVGDSDFSSREACQGVEGLHFRDGLEHGGENAQTSAPAGETFESVAHGAYAANCDECDERTDHGEGEGRKRNLAMKITRQHIEGFAVGIAMIAAIPLLAFAARTATPLVTSLFPSNLVYVNMSPPVVSLPSAPPPFAHSNTRRARERELSSRALPPQTSSFIPVSNSRSSRQC